MRPCGAIRIAAALLISGALLGCRSRPDRVSGASMVVAGEHAPDHGTLPGHPVIVTPADRGGAARIASAMAARLGASIVSPAAVTPGELTKAPLLGLGSGIFDQAHHQALLDLAEAFPPSFERKAFIFSTSGVSRRMAPGLREEDPHKALRERLLGRGFEIVGEFNCVGYNDNSFLFLIGGLNKGHPNAEDISRAEAFADSLLQGGGR